MKKQSYHVSTHFAKIVSKSGYKNHQNAHFAGRTSLITLAEALEKQLNRKDNMICVTTWIISGQIVTVPIVH